MNVLYKLRECLIYQKGLLRIDKYVTIKRMSDKFQPELISLKKIVI